MRHDCKGLIWPSKFYGIIAANKPIIFIGPQDAEIAQIITNKGLGIAIESASLDTAIAFISKLSSDPKERAAYANRIQAYHRTLAGLDGAVKAWTSIVDQSFRALIPPSNP